MAGYPPPYPPSGPPQGPSSGPVDRQAWKYQRRMLKDQAKAQRDQHRFQMQAMRRRSILGPVLVVVIGIVFLLVQTGHLRNDRVWDVYGRWWPLLLVAGGLVLLVEWGVDQLLPRDQRVPYARRSVGGGVIALVILLSVGGALLHGVHHGRDFLAHNFALDPDDLSQFVGSKHESDETLVQALPEGGAVTIENPKGDVTITGSSNDGQVHLALHRQVFSWSDSQAENKARELMPQMTTNGKLLSIVVPSMTGVTTDLTVTVPSTAAVTVNSNRGDVHVDALRAPVTITANHGEVALSEIGGAVVAHGNHGGSSFSAHRITGPLTLEGRAQDVTLSDVAGAVNLSGDFYGTTHLEHISQTVKFHTSRTDFELARLDGEVEVSSERISADQMAGPVVLTTRNRNINLDRVSGALSVTNRNGTVDLTSAPPLGNVTVQNRNGTVTLTLPDHANFAVNAETNDGDVQNDFSLPSQDIDDRKTLTGTVGKGGSLVRINTSQGDVVLRKATVAALSPRPPVPPAPPERPIVSINGQDGSSVYVGKDGVRILSGQDGSSVIVGKDGLKISANADGSSVYHAKNGTQLTEGADGSKVYVSSSGTRLTQSADGSVVYAAANGTRYTKGADGGVTYESNDGARITVQADGSQTATASGKPLNEEQIRERLRRVEEDLRRAEESIAGAERQRDQERREHTAEHRAP